MSNEIKIIYEEVEKGLSTLKTATEAVSTTFTECIQGDNMLDTKEIINALNVSLQNLVKEYQTLLLANEQATHDAVQTMKETDEHLGTSMQWESTVS